MLSGLFFVSKAAPLGTWTVPAYVIFADFAYKADTLQHVRDVVNSPFLDVKGFDGLIKVKSLVDGFFQQVDELFSELDKAILFATSSVPAIAHVDTSIGGVVGIKAVA